MKKDTINNAENIKDCVIAKKKSIILDNDIDFPQKEIKTEKQNCNKNCKCKKVEENPYENIIRLNCMIKGKEEIREQIRQLIKNNPNDFDLGKIVREKFI